MHAQTHLFMGVFVCGAELIRLFSHGRVIHSSFPWGMSGWKRKKATILSCLSWHASNSAFAFREKTGVDRRRCISKTQRFVALAQKTNVPSPLLQCPVSFERRFGFCHDDDSTSTAFSFLREPSLVTPRVVFQRRSVIPRARRQDF